MLALKKNNILPFVTTTWINLVDIKLGEMSQTEKDKYCMVLCVKSKKRKICEVMDVLTCWK